MVQILTLRRLRVASLLDFDDQNPYLTRGFLLIWNGQNPYLTHPFLSNTREIVEILTLREDSRRCYTLLTAGSSKSLPYTSVFVKHPACSK